MNLVAKVYSYKHITKWNYKEKKPTFAKHLLHTVNIHNLTQVAVVKAQVVITETKVWKPGSVKY